MVDIPDMGTINLLRGVVVGRGEAGAAVEVGSVVLHVRGQAPPPGASVVLAVRPEKLRLDPHEGLENLVRARVAGVVDLGEAVDYRLETTAGLALVARELTARRGPRFAVGDRVRVGWAAAVMTIVAE